VPEGLAIAFAFDQNDEAGGAHPLEPPEPVKARLRALLPAEPLVALGPLLQPQAIADRPLSAVGVAIWNHHGRRAEVGHLPQTEPLQEFDGEALRLGIGRERQTRARPLTS